MNLVTVGQAITKLSDQSRFNDQLRLVLNTDVNNCNQLWLTIFVFDVQAEQISTLRNKSVNMDNCPGGGGHSHTKGVRVGLDG